MPWCRTRPHGCHTLPAAKPQPPPAASPCRHALHVQRLRLAPGAKRSTRPLSSSIPTTRFRLWRSARAWRRTRWTFWTRSSRRHPRTLRKPHLANGQVRSLRLRAGSPLLPRAQLQALWVLQRRRHHQLATTRRRRQATNRTTRRLRPTRPQPPVLPAGQELQAGWRGRLESGRVDEGQAVCGRSLARSRASVEFAPIASEGV